MRIKFLKLAVVGALVSTSLQSFAIDITGAGASFPAPVYSKWAEEYKKVTKNSVN